MIICEKFRLYCVSTANVTKSRASEVGDVNDVGEEVIDISRGLLVIQSTHRGIPDLIEGYGCIGVIRDQQDTREQVEVLGSVLYGENCIYEYKELQAI